MAYMLIPWYKEVRTINFIDTLVKLKLMNPWDGPGSLYMEAIIVVIQKH